MTFEERENAIGTLLRDTLLPRYKRPEHLDDVAARLELRDMVADLNREWPVESAEAFAARAERFCRDVRATHAGRSWPAIATLLKALKSASVAYTATTEDEPPVVYDGVVTWWQKHRDRCPWAKENHSARLVADGHATWGQLRREGFPIPPERMAEARAEPDPRHNAIMADIAALGRRLKDSNAPGAFSANPAEDWRNVE